MDALALFRVATRRYLLATTVLAASATALVWDVVQVRHGVLSRTHRLMGLLLFVCANYTFIFLRGAKEFYRKMVALGCEPPSALGQDVTGIRYLLDTAAQIKAHALLEGRQKLLREHGGTFEHKLFPEPNIAITTDDPENVKALLMSKFDDWILPRERIKGFVPVLGLHSIFTTNGVEWQHSRAMLRPAFMRDSISDLEVFDRHIGKMMSHIPHDGSPVDLQILFNMMAIDTSSEFMFGISTDMLGNPTVKSTTFTSGFDTAMAKIAWRSRLGWLTTLLPDKELDEAMRRVRAYTDEFIAAKKEEVSGKKLQGGVDKGAKRYVFMNELLMSGEPDEVVRSQLLSMIVAGKDTTTSALSYLFLELSRNPDVVAKLQREIRDLGVTDPTWEQIRNMKMLNWTIKESLRLSPPVATNGREAARDTVLPRGGGPDHKSPILVPKGSMCRYNPWAMHRRTEIYGTDADQFRPERWETLRVTSEYLPFNGGPRICIGQQFALTQLAMVTFRMLQRLDKIERSDDRPIVQKIGLNTSLLHGCRVKCTWAE